MQFKKDTIHNDLGGEATVEGEWLDGVPHGICLIEDD
jgi:hypothetical protein